MLCLEVELLKALRTPGLWWLVQFEVAYHWVHPGGPYLLGCQDLYGLFLNCALREDFYQHLFCQMVKYHRSELAESVGLFILGSGDLRELEYLEFCC